MRLSTWRPNFITWLNSHIVIDSWNLENPELEKALGFLAPLTDVKYTKENFKEYHGSAKETFAIRYRYPETMKYSELPIGFLEGLHCTFSLKLSELWGTLGLLGLELDTVADPISISEIGDDRGEWLIELRWDFTIKWLAEPEETIYQPFDFNRIDLGLYRSYLLDFQQNTLDLQVTIKK